MKKMMLLACLGILFSLAGAEKDKVLVVYFSWSDAGNTRQVAEIIAKAVKGDCEAIVPQKNYSRKYTEVLRRGRQELQQSASCPIVPVKKDLQKYNVVFVGTPVWFGTYAPPVRSFLQKYDLKGKKVYFFCTHGKGGAGKFFKDAKKLCAGFDEADGFSCYGTHVKTIAPQVNAWVKKVMK